MCFSILNWIVNENPNFGHLKNCENFLSSSLHFYKNLLPNSVELDKSHYAKEKEKVEEKNVIDFNKSKLTTPYGF